MEPKRQKNVPVRFADEYAGCEVAIYDYFGAFRGDKVPKRDMYFSEILQNIYMDCHLLFFQPLAPTEDELAELHPVSPCQPHPVLFTWATKLKLGIPTWDVTFFILLHEVKTKISEPVATETRAATRTSSRCRAYKYRLVGGESRAFAV